MYAYIVPMVATGNYRDPALVKSRFADGVNCRWACKDFGDSPLTLVVTDTALTGAVFSFDSIEKPITGKQRADLIATLRDAGLEPSWVANSNSHREALHKVVGLSQSIQANDDAPDRWLGRPIYFGFDALPPLDAQMFLTEQVKIKRAAEVRVGDWIIDGACWVNEKTGKTIPVISGGALPATEAFTGSDNTTPINANWTNNAGSIRIRSNAFAPAATSGNGSFQLSRWNADAFGANQYSKCVVTANGGNDVGVSVRISTSGASTAYNAHSDNSGIYPFKAVAGVMTDLGSPLAALSVNDVIYIEANGTTIVYKKNTTTIGTYTDSSISSGSAGITASDWGSGSNANLGDTWEGGDLGSVATSLIYDDRSRRFQTMLVR